MKQKQYCKHGVELRNAMDPARDCPRCEAEMAGEHEDARYEAEGEHAFGRPETWE